MFCVKSDVITLESIEMYGFVTVWTSMDDGPYWVILLMYGSHDMRHRGFRRLTVVNGTPGILGFTNTFPHFNPKMGTKTRVGRIPTSWSVDEWVGSLLNPETSISRISFLGSLAKSLVIGTHTYPSLMR